MSEALTRAEPVPQEAFVGDGVSVNLAPPCARFSLRAHQAQALETILKLKLPKKIGATEGGAACLGPDEWLLRLPAGTRIPLGEGLPLAVTDISERAVCLVVEGTRAAEVLMAGCPLDLDRFAKGRVSRTIFETVEIILIRSDEHRFEIEVWCSFAPWLHLALLAAAAQLS